MNTLRIVFACLLACLLAAPQARVAAFSNTCSWTGFDEKTNAWESSENWACTGGGTPSADSQVIISGGVKIPFLSSHVTVGSLLISSELDFNTGAELTAAGGWTATDGARLHGGGTMGGAGTVGPGTVYASITFSGDVTIMPLGSLKTEGAPFGRITATGTVYNNGTLSSADSDGNFHMQGTLFANSGTVSVPLVVFDRGGGLSTNLSGAGEWTSAVDLRVEMGTKLKPTSLVTLKTRAFTVGVEGTGSVLDLSGASVIFDGSGGAVKVNITDAATGSYAIRTRGSVEIGTVYGSNLSAPLRVETGITTASGFLHGGVEINSGATLRVNQAPGGELIVYADVINDGTVSGVEDGSSFVFAGEHFTNNGTVSAGQFHFQKPGSAQRLSGTGAWTNRVNLFVDGDTSLSLVNSVAMNVKTFSVQGVDTLAKRDHLDLKGYTLTLTGPSTFWASSDSRITGSAELVTRGPVTVRTTGAEVFQPTLRIQAGPSAQPGYQVTTLYGRCDGPVIVDSGAKLALNGDSQVFLNNNLTVTGSLDAEENSLLTLRGAEIKVDGTFTSKGSVTLQSTAAQTLSGSGTIQALDFFVETPAGAGLSLPLSVGRSLTLTGDLRSTGSGVTLALAASTWGEGDVWGRVTRAGPFAWDTPYTFNSERTLVTLLELSLAHAPTAITIELVKGSSGALPGGIRWYRVTPSGGSLFGADLRLAYRQSEWPDEASESLLRLYQRASGPAPWALQKDAVQHEGGNWFEQSAVTQFGDFAIAGAHKIYAPYVRQ